MSSHEDSSDGSAPSRAARAGTPSSAERWRRIVGLVEVALDLEKPLRGAYLEAVTRQDPELRRQVHRMLRHFGIEGWHDLPTPPQESGGVPAELGAERIGPYRLLEVLGRGGMGVVYLGERHDQEFERKVAIKIIGAGLDAPIVHQRFLSERQILARFDHPNIARLFEGGTTADGRPYFVLEYIEGLPLDAHCEAHRLSLEERLHLFADICSAVSYAHQNLVVHRDLKPSNILVDREGKAKLLDFGIAKLLDPSAMPFAIEATRTSLRPMTPSYAAPEQIVGARITTATDVYSLGVLLYRLLAGRLPFELAGHSSAEEMNALRRQDPQRPSQVLEAALREGAPPPTWEGQDAARIARRLRGDLDNIVRKALRYEPEQRYGSVGEFAEDLRGFERGEPVTATRDTPLYTLGKFVRKYRWVVAATGLVLLLLSSFLVASWRQARAIARERDRAESSAREAQVTRDFLVGLLHVADGSSLVDNKVPLGDLLDQGFARLEKGEVESDSARAELFEVLAGSYESLRDYRRAARARQKAAELAESLGRPGAEIRSNLMAAAYNYQLAGEFPAATAVLEAARRHASPEEQVTIDLHLLEGDFQSSDEASFRQRAQALLQGPAADPTGEVVALNVLVFYLNIRESQGASQEVLDLAARLLELIGSRATEGPFRDLKRRIHMSESRAYYTLGKHLESLEALEASDRLSQVKSEGGRSHAGGLMDRLLLARARLAAGRLEQASADLDEIGHELAKLSQVDPRDPRARFLEARLYLLRNALAKQRGAPPVRQEAEAAARILAELHQEMPTSVIDLNFARALLLLGRREEARQVALPHLRTIRNGDMVEVAAEAGLALPPPSPGWQLELPPWLQERLAAATVASPR